ncbi:MAG: hypothetical protein DCC49_02160 [Acidobacteria bacterium]|nr:MAG: hypothetical protein DCC49_02160 [Acidobacteriota bacterium]
MAARSSGNRNEYDQWLATLREFRGEVLSHRGYGVRAELDYNLGSALSAFGRNLTELERLAAGVPADSGDAQRSYFFKKDALSVEMREKIDRTLSNTLSSGQRVLEIAKACIHRLYTPKSATRQTLDEKLEVFRGLDVCAAFQEVRNTNDHAGYASWGQGSSNTLNGDGTIERIFQVPLAAKKPVLNLKFDAYTQYSETRDDNDLVSMLKEFGQGLVQLVEDLTDETLCTERAAMDEFESMRANLKKHERSRPNNET